MISPLDSARGLPCSRVRMAARSSMCSMIRACHLCRQAARCRAVMRFQGPKAREAASMAVAVSARPALGTVLMIAPVAGLFTSMVLPSKALVHLPSMKHWVLKNLDFSICMSISLRGVL